MKIIRPCELGQHKQRITHLQGEANYTFVYFVDQPRLLLSSTLCACLDSLPGFIRIHRKYAINADFALSQPTKFGQPQLIVHTHYLPVSRRLLKTVQQALANVGLASLQPEPAKLPESLSVQITHSFYRDLSLTWK